MEAVFLNKLQMMCLSDEINRLLGLKDIEGVTIEKVEHDMILQPHLEPTTFSFPERP